MAGFDELKVLYLFQLLQFLSLVRSMLGATLPEEMVCFYRRSEISSKPSRLVEPRANSFSLAFLLLHEGTPRTLSGWVAILNLTLKAHNQLTSEKRYLRVISQSILMFLSLYLLYRLSGTVQNDLEWRAAKHSLRELP